MNTIKIVRYTLKTDRAAENEQRIKAVFLQMLDKKLPGIEYAVYKLADGVSYYPMRENRRTRPSSTCRHSRSSRPRPKTALRNHRWLAEPKK